MPPKHRHQSSLEAVIGFSNPFKLEEAQRSRGKQRFYQLVEHFKAQANSDRPYSRPLLLQFTYEYSRSEDSKDNFLQVFFDSLGIPLAGEEYLDYDALADDFNGFAEYLRENFFQPLVAAGSKTTQPTPKYDSAVQKLQASHLTVGTPDRIAGLRGACLQRDKHRCVITREFDAEEMRNKLKERRELIDDNGVPLTNNPHGFEVLEVAHILPHSLTKADSEANPKLASLSDSKLAALNILNLFDPGVVHLIEGVDIDRPLNAITMSQKMHKFFGRLEIYFEPVESSAYDHTYKIDTFYPELFSGILPVTRTFYDTDKSIDMPSPRLLAIHYAIAHVLHLSGAGDYIDNLLRDMEHMAVKADGSTRLDEMVKLRLGGWWDGTVRS